MATAAAPEAAPAGGGKKKLIIIIVALVLVLVVGGVAAVLLLKKKPAAEGEGEEEAQAAAHVPAPAPPKPGTPPVFVPLEPFTVNLADKDVDRFAQVGVTLEVADPKFADQLKAYMPAIRSNILMTLSYKTSAELLSREGKEKLAREIMRESVRPLGIEIEDEDEEASGEEPKKKKKKRRAPVYNPVTNVLFSSFIVQ
ncbi:MAG: flagellar basal body-associated FliL family protein [Roseateles asaccharophilus]|uniref:Flagellar protein FliL n=1 Tax=Roseateles asaccharophilus TaxID=582607 RepID=A0A4R6MTC7_9BURK|nr:flagellar basal body-associated FliL family protein [Roseateles asaccharophilus]MDN3546509.1 flagellar basal body-associated FliL family protein [Roseateles asaccharophilus]TDP05549.1 flagellar FliL protein [Roseateles asaccharophilus]